MQEIEIWLYEQVAYAQLGICPVEWDPQSSLEFWDINRSPNLGQTTRPIDSQWKEENQLNTGFPIPADDKVKLKKSKKRDKYLDFARELKKQWNMKVMIIPVVIGTIPKVWLKGLKDC